MDHSKVTICLIELVAVYPRVARWSGLKTVESIWRAIETTCGQIDSPIAILGLSC